MLLLIILANFSLFIYSQSCHLYWQFVTPEFVILDIYLILCANCKVTIDEGAGGEFFSYPRKRLAFKFFEAYVQTIIFTKHLREHNART